MKISLSPTRQGAWIVNISKHLVNFASINLGLSLLENIFFAGKCGALLIKLSADETEQLTPTKVKAHAQVCGINGAELPTYLNTLKQHGCLDWDHSGSAYEVLPFSRERVLETTSKVFTSLLETREVEKALPYLLEYCLLRPRLHSEVKKFLTENMLTEEDADCLLDLVHSFNILGVEIVIERFEKLYYNEYQFGDKNQAVKIGTAVSNLPKPQQAELNTLLQEVASKPGTPPESIKVSEETKVLAISLGLIEVSEVASFVGSARFLTLPRLLLPTVGQETANLEDDVFHHAKMLLTSLRFGELRSDPSRGKINQPYVLVKRLLERDHVGPCTAIGQDYVILEGEGVIKTVQANYRSGNQFYMELRRREPAEIVLNLLNSDANTIIDASSLSKNLELPQNYTGPEVARPVAAKIIKSKNPEAFKRFLEELRT